MEIEKDGNVIGEYHLKDRISVDIEEKMDGCASSEWCRLRRKLCLRKRRWGICKDEVWQELIVKAGSRARVTRANGKRSH